MEELPTYVLKDCEIPIGDTYILDGSKLLYESSLKSVFLGKIRNSNKTVAIKLEKINDSPTLFNEFKFLTHLQDIERISKVIWAGSQGKYNILIMELLGPSLKNLMKFCKGKFTLATTLKISIQVLDILRQIHDKGVLLRYLKPANMVIGSGDKQKYIYLIDFELAKLYIRKGKHISYREDKAHIKGNRHFVSININNRIQGSRRDDIESLGYNLIYFMKGELPWSEETDSYNILQIKMKTSLDTLCEGLPDEFKEFIEYGRNLGFKDKPDYSYLQKLLIKAAEKNGIDLDKVEYDWISLKRKEKEDRQKINEKDTKENIRNSGEKEVNKDENNINKIVNEKDKELNMEENKHLNKNEEMAKKEEIKDEENKSNSKDKQLNEKERKDENKELRNEQINEKGNKIEKFEEDKEQK